MTLSLDYLTGKDSAARVLAGGEFNTMGLTATEYEAGDKALVFLANEKYLPEFLANTGISAVVCTEETAGKLDKGTYGICCHPRPKEFFYLVHNHLVMETAFYGEAQLNRIDPSAKIHPTAVIAERNVIIGKNVVIEAHTVIHEKCSLADGVVIGAGSVIGGGGFQAVKTEDSVFMVIPGGWVRLEKNVEIANNTCVDRAIFSGKTRIDENSKIDNLVYIAHDVYVGKNCLIVALSSITGRCFVGNDVWIGASAVIRNGIKIGNNARISMGAVVTKNVAEGCTVSGNFAIEHSKFIQYMKSIS